MATTPEQSLNESSDRLDAIHLALKRLSIMLQAIPVGEREAVDVYVCELDESAYSTPTIVQACRDLSIRHPESQFERYKFPPLEDILTRCRELRPIEDRSRVDPNCPECQGMGMKIFPQPDGRAVSGPCPKCHPKVLNMKGNA